jgi:hypothetical protein
MDSDTRNALLTEYTANVELWKHDDSLRQQRNSTFLAVNTVLLSAIAALGAFKTQAAILAAVTCLFSIFGVAVCRVWQDVQLRNAEYVRFRRLQLKAIEARLGELSTFSNTYAAFNEMQTVEFPSTGQVFTVEHGSSESSTSAEGRLPRLLTGLWIVVAVGAPLLAVLQR